MRPGNSAPEYGKAGNTRSSGKRMNQSRLERLLVILSWLAPAAVLVFAFYRLDFPVIRSDGLAYYAWLHTLIEDGNVSLANEFSTLQEAGVLQYQLFQIPETGRAATPFPFGSALLWAPFYRAILSIEHAGWYLRQIAPRVDEAAYMKLQGASFLAGLGMTLGTNLMALLSVYLTMDIIRRWVSPLLASFSVIAAFLGTPMVYYSSIEPTMAHVPAIFTISLLYWLFFRFGMYSDQGKQERPWIWLLIGLVVALSATIRWQMVLTGLPLALILLYQRRWRSLSTFCLGTLLLVWTVPWSWNQMFGKPFVVPESHGDPTEFLIGLQNPLLIWFSPLRGLFVWSPVVALAVIGWYLARRRCLQAVFLFAATFLLQSLIDAVVRDWWAGWSFGMRRMVELYPLYALGLAFFVDDLISRAARRRNRGAVTAVLSSLPLLGVVAAVMWSLLLLVTYAGALIDQQWGTVVDVLVFWHQCSAECRRILLQRLADWYGLPAWNTPPRWGQLAVGGSDLLGSHGLGVTAPIGLVRSSARSAASPGRRIPCPCA